MNEQGPVEAREGDLREKAEKRVKEKIALLSNIASYVIINIFIFLVWGFTSDWSGYPWFIWVLIGWGIGLAFHIFNYYSGKKGEAARERMIKQEMERMKDEQE